MKTNYMISTVLKALTFVTLAFGITNCNKSNNNGNVGLANGYRLVNNVCYQTMNGVSMPAGNPSICTQMNAPMYQMNGGICYQIIPNGQPIQQQNTMLCTTNGTGAYGATGPCAPQMINGQYVQQPYCNSGMGGTNGMYGMGQVCSGYYHDQNNQTATCNPQLPPGQQSQDVNGQVMLNCSGMTLLNQVNQMVYCQ